MKIKTVFLRLLQFLQGFTVGAGAVLPGISGGALCVSFGYYVTLIEVVSDPIKGIKKHFATVLAFGLGWLAAFFICAGMIGRLFAHLEFEATMFFGGLIFGSLPSLFKDAKKDGMKKSGVWGFAIGFVLSALLLAVFQTNVGKVQPSILWYAFVGVLWGFSLIFPGLNTTPVTVSLGLYDSWASGVSGFDPGVMLPWIIALALTAFALSRTVKGVIKKHYCFVAHTVLGIVTSSTLMMLTDAITDADILAVPRAWLLLPLIACGFAAAVLLDKWSKKAQEPTGTIGRNVNNRN